MFSMHVRLQEAMDKQLDDQARKIGIAYEHFDANANGWLDFGEYKEMMTEVAPGITEEDLLDLFDKCQLASLSAGGMEKDSINQVGLCEVLAEHSHLLSPHYRVGKTPFVEAEELGKSLLSTQSIQSMSQAAAVQKGMFTFLQKLRIAVVISANNEEERERKERERKSVERLSGRGPKDVRTQEIIKTALRNTFLFRHLDDAGLQTALTKMLPHPVKRGKKKFLTVYASICSLADAQNAAWVQVTQWSSRARRAHTFSFASLVHMMC